MTIKAVDSVTIIDLTDLESVKTWYLAVPRTSSAPVVSPAATEAQMRSAGWGTEEPGVDTTKKLYTVQQNIFGDGTYIWGSVCLSSSYEAAIQAYNLANAASGTANKALSQSVEYIVGTQTAATNAWTGVTTDPALVVGKSIAYKLPYAGTSTAATLNLTLSGGGTTGAKTIRWNSGSAVTTHYGAGAVINMTWDGTYWRICEYNSDTTNRLRCQNVIKAAAAIAAEQVICGTESGYEPVAVGTAFDISYPLLVAGSAISSGSTGDNNYFSRNGVTPKNGTTAVTGLTQYATVYLKGTLSGKTFTIVSPVYTTVVPTSDDGYVYKPVGQAYSTTAMYFSGGLDKSIYAYRNGAFREIDTVSDYINDIDSRNGMTFKPANVDLVNGADSQKHYVKLNADGMDVYIGGDSYAHYGTTARIGKENKARTVIGPYETAMYTDDNVQYFLAKTDGTKAADTNTSYRVPMVSTKADLAYDSTSILIMLSDWRNVDEILSFNSGSTFRIVLVVDVYAQDTSVSGSGYTFVSTDIISHEFTKGTSEDWTGDTRSVASPYFYSFIPKYYYRISSGKQTVQAAITTIKRSSYSTKYNLRFMVTDARIEYTVSGAPVPTLDFIGSFRLSLNNLGEIDEDDELYWAIVDMGWNCGIEYGGVIVNGGSPDDD